MRSTRARYRLHPLGGLMSAGGGSQTPKPARRPQAPGGRLPASGRPPGPGSSSNKSRVRPQPVTAGVPHEPNGFPWPVGIDPVLIVNPYQPASLHPARNPTGESWGEKQHGASMAESCSVSLGVLIGHRLDGPGCFWHSRGDGGGSRFLWDPCGHLAAAWAGCPAELTQGVDDPPFPSAQVAAAAGPARWRSCREQPAL